MTCPQDRKAKSVSPAYDVTRTTTYPDLSRNMGIGIGTHRSLDAINVPDFSVLAKRLGIGRSQTKQDMAELAESFAPALMEATHSLEAECGKTAEELTERIVRDSLPHREQILKASLTI